MAAEQKQEELSFEYVVLGGGNAAGYAVAEFVKNGEGKKICMISAEDTLPYERPALSKGFLLGKAKLPGFNCCAFFKDMHEQKWYDENGVKVMLSSLVTNVDFDKKALTYVCGGKENIVKYNKLLLGTGCSAIRLTDFKMKGADKSGIYYLRDHGDAVVLLKAIEEAPKDQNVIVVGGGYIGMEVTSALIEHGFKSITMVFPEDHMLAATVFTPEIAQHYHELYQKHGVKFVQGMVASFNTKDAGITGIKLKNGKSVDGKFAIVGIGARPNVSLFQDKLKMAERGVLVNGLLETSVKDVYACGDIATFPCPVLDNQLTRLEHVRHARASAIHAAKVMMTKEKSMYDFCPVFYSRVLDKNWIFYGTKPDDASVEVSGDFNPKLLVVWRAKKDSKIKGIFMESGDENDIQIIENAVKKGLVAPSLKLNDKGQLSRL